MNKLIILITLLLTSCIDTQVPLSNLQCNEIEYTNAEKQTEFCEKLRYRGVREKEMCYYEAMVRNCHLKPSK